MSYTNFNIIVPADKRESINNKILQIIESGKMNGITAEEIFNTYTGIGGLHGLDRSDFHHYAAFSDAKKEYENGQFFTSASICEYIMNILKPSPTDLVADLTFGMGTFFNYCPTQSNCYGVELDPSAFKVAQFLYPQANLEMGDLQYYETDLKFDLIIGNPPFNLSWKNGLSQLVYCNKAGKMLKPGAIMAIITPLSFMADDFSNKSQIESIEDNFNFVGQFKLPATGFRHLGVQNFNTKVLILQKRSEHLPQTRIEPTIFIDPKTEIYTRFIQPIRSINDNLKSKLNNELSNNEFGNNWSFSKRNDYEHEGFAYRVRKYMFEIKSHSILRTHLSKAEQYLEQFHTQEKPEDMDWKEWDKKKVTEAKVIAYLLKVIKLQSKKAPEEKIRLVKQNYGLKIKAFSPKTTRQVKKLFEQTYYPFYDLVQYDENPINERLVNLNKGIAVDLIEKKKKSFNRQSQVFDDMKKNVTLDHYLSNFTFIGKDKSIEALNEIQKNDLGLMFQKKYGSLNWEQGSGKTIAGYAFIKMLQESGTIKQAFIVSTALAITATWIPFLQNQHEDFIETRSLEAIENLSTSSSNIIALIPLSMITKYQRQLKNLVRSKGNKVALVFDESDEITSHTANRTKSTLNIFRRAKYKLETTGTTTRNNINEWYSQLELLYNNSVNMICTAPKKYREDKKDVFAQDGIIEKPNEYYMKPFPAYRGFNLFRACFNPFKKTVFGIEKQNQDIYNPDSLLELIKKTVITRKFKEIAGDGKYEVHNTKVYMNDHEEEVYLKILNEFQALEKKYCNSTGNSKKDAMLRLIKQINLLIKATSMPHKFSEYDYESNGILPTKFSKIKEMVESKPNEQFMIGTIRKDAAAAYFKFLSDLFPFRPIWIANGDTSLNKRRTIVKEFQSTFDGILISTQQSFKSSVNIPTCNNVIVESLQWNLPKISQYYFRAIRYDSIGKTNVFFITYEYSLEQNIMALLMSKEAINDFIKNKEYKRFSDVLQEYDVDPNLLGSIMTKRYDDEGKMKLNWGKQKVA